MSIAAITRRDVISRRSTRLRAAASGTSRAPGSSTTTPRSERPLTATAMPSTRNGRRTSPITVRKPATGGPNTNPARYAA